jgi:cellulase/cellobiase CelA1
MTFAVAILVLLVVWVAVRAVGPAEASRQPTVVLPSMPQVTVKPAVSPSSLSPSPALAVSSSPSRSAVVSSAASPSPRHVTPTGVPETTRKPIAKPSPTTRRTSAAAPSPAASFAATIRVSGSWRFGYTGTVTIENKGNAASDWRITVAHSGVDNLRLLNTWGARGSRDGDDVVFTGDSLTPGASVSFRYQVTKTGRGDARPSGCSVVGGTCDVS